ncbi:CRP-like cAMP-binding protein [Kushneria sinocarnis]|uniref:CRP-like cAMP-binding protein n=1 Tax=Kushneria sinocarnis TaxID=595502 RepID=A0A420WSI1_9GAMM|nr:Crp/Fnr family transcriptional regulator [Kushneria sinocarnis]RKQ95713.1 CRP-like cAMP-binding protein [Kushneria sinocarnis]
MSENVSCMVRHFRHYADLGDDEIELLGTLERSPEHLTPGETLWLEGSSADELAVVSKGWAYSFYSLKDGNRLILDIYLPGDVIGLREFATSEHLASVETITECTICRFPHKHLTDVFKQSSKLTRVFFAVASTQQSILVERMINLGRRDAVGRIAHFLCEMHTRLERTNDDMQGQFRLPLSQQMLADTMGLSAVHVSRVFSQLRNETLVERERHRIRIPDFERLVRFAGFNNNYLGTRSIIQNRD